MCYQYDHIKSFSHENLNDAFNLLDLYLYVYCQLIDIHAYAEESFI